VIQQNTGMDMHSVPFVFRLSDGGTAAPEEKQAIGGILPNH
jgi:hypothetical protein